MFAEGKPKKEITVQKAYSVYIFLSNVYRKIIKKGLYTALKTYDQVKNQLLTAELRLPPDWSFQEGVLLHFS